MSHVHELCLVKWLLAKNIRHCELCKAKFTIKEEIGTALEIAKDLFQTSVSSRKRIVSAAIYSIYLYFIGKRFIVCTKYLSKVIFDGLLALFKSYLKLALAEWRFIIRLVRIPFRSSKNYPKSQSLYRAVNLWLRGIVDAFMPSWI